MVLGIMLFGCASKEPTVPPSGKVVEINLVAKQFEFSPSTINVKKGDHVKIILTSMDTTHGFSIPEFNVNKQVSPGSTSVIEFNADKSGTFEFHCSVFCGSGHSEMMGKLVVEE